MHILEHHKLEWIGQRHMGCGLMDEQGAESVHSQLYRTYKNYESLYKRSAL